MAHLPLLRDLLIIFALSVAVVLVFQRFRFPLTVGFLATGVIFGPYALGFISQREEVEALAEIGVVLLLFTIGVEFSLSRLARMKREILVGGSLQVFVTAVIAFLVSLPFRISWADSVVVAFLIAFSSTAIVLRSFSESGELSTPPAKVSLGILIYQDLFVVPIMLFIPLLAGWQGFSWLGLAQVLGIAVLTVALVLLAARFAIPPFLQLAVSTRSREVFLIAVILVVLGTAWAASWAGLSLALGAFVAGLVVSESEYSHQVLSDILPFRDALSSLFFVSIGMLLDLRFVLENLWALIPFVFLILGFKFFIVALVVGFLGYPQRVAARSGVALAQVGEFSFVLVLVARNHGLLGDGVYQTILAGSVCSMLLSSLLFQRSKWVGEALERMEKLRPLFPGPESPGPETEAYSDSTRPVILVGYGHNGRNLARVLRRLEVPYRVLELNPETVKQASRACEPIVYGDSTSREVLQKLGVASARALVVAISDAPATERTVQLARTLSPSLPILVRTKYVNEIDPLYELGVDEVVPEEFEASVELCRRTLQQVGVPVNLVARELRGIREQRYQMFRDRQPRLTHIGDLPRRFLETRVETYTILNSSWARGRSLGEMGLRERSGATILSLIDRQQVHASPDSEWSLQAGHTLVLMGNAEELALACHLLDQGPEGSPVSSSRPAMGGGAP